MGDRMLDFSSDRLEDLFLRLGQVGSESSQAAMFELSRRQTVAAIRAADASAKAAEATARSARYLFWSSVGLVLVGAAAAVAQFVAVYLQMTP